MNTNNTPAPPILPWHREAAKEIDDNPFTQEAAELAAIIARHDPHAAQEDKERLDWLASQCYYPYDHPQDGVFVVVSDNVAPHGAFTLERDGDRKALRAAIDHARAQPTQ